MKPRLASRQWQVTTEVKKSQTLPRAVAVLLFVYGVSQFFVSREPGAPEFVAPLVVLFLVQRAVFHPVQLLLLASNVMAMAIELMVFHTAAWSLISVYLTVSGMALHSIATRFDAVSSTRAFALGGAVGAAINLAALATPMGASLYKYGIRFEGFFMDPNVTAPTGAFFAILAFVLPGRWRWVAVFPFAVFALALSRATLLAFAVAMCYLFLSRYRVLVPFVVIGAFVAALNAKALIALVGNFFSTIGRGGVVNYYDADRSSNWELLLKLAWEQGEPLGPTYSDRLYGTGEGISAHSTYIRVLVEQGPLALVCFTLAVIIAWYMAKSRVTRAALLLLLVNGAVIDATHWRVLFLAIALAIVYPAISPVDSVGTRELRNERDQK